LSRWNMEQWFPVHLNGDEEDRTRRMIHQRDRAPASVRVYLLDLRRCTSCNMSGLATRHSTIKLLDKIIALTPDGTYCIVHNMVGH
jgi:hypothetical protein